MEDLEKKTEENLNNEEPKVVDENEHTYHTVDAKKVELKDNYNFFYRSKFKYFWSRFLIIFFGIFAMPWIICINGFRIKGKKNWKKIKKKGCILVSNHVNPGDAFFIGWTLMRKRVYFTSLQSNLGLPFGFGKLIRILGAVPIPEKKSQMPRFRAQFLEDLARGRKITVYPEAALLPYCDHIRPFKKGAFRLALVDDTPILPIVFTYRKPKGLYRIWRRKPCLTINFLEPYYPTNEGSHAERINRAMTDIHDTMESFFNEHSTYFYHKKEKTKKEKKNKKVEENITNNEQKEDE
ncbi:MAG: 1-acyl-sn-glycerol-3-phosphate acyltransferase [Acholeplasmatales bacterium]|nr:1-acyl-sn-glycerol-3-phosphate acyltransferase [Acholeplasmatales bacterium]